MQRCTSYYVMDNSIRQPVIRHFHNADYNEILFTHSIFLLKSINKKSPAPCRAFLMFNCSFTTVPFPTETIRTTCTPASCSTSFWQNPLYNNSLRSTMPLHRLPPPPCRMKFYPAQMMLGSKGILPPLIPDCSALCAPFLWYSHAAILQIRLQ